MTKEEAWSKFYEYGCFNFIDSNIDDTDMADIETAFYDGFNLNKEKYNEYLLDHREWHDSNQHMVDLVYAWNIGQYYKYDKA